MGAVVERSSTELAEFDPAAVKTKDAKLDAVIEYAKRVRDWPLLEQAVDQKIEEQAEFVKWWDDNIGVRHGAGRGKKSADRGTFSMDDAEELTGITNQQVSRWRKRLADIEAYRAKLYGKAWREAFGGTKAHVSNNSGENEWYTPPQYIEAAREVMGSIDLDPASCAKANEIVQAKAYFTVQENGLQQEWYGNVWLNPPYAQPLIAMFSEAVVTKRADYDAACVLVNNATDTEWLQAMLEICDAACFVKKRIKFIDKQGEPSGAPLQGQVVVYMGDRAERFAEVFSQFGWVCRRA